MLLGHFWNAATGHRDLQQGDTEQSSSIHSSNKYSGRAVRAPGAHRASLTTGASYMRGTALRIGQAFSHFLCATIYEVRWKFCWVVFH